MKTLTFRAILTASWLLEIGSGVVDIVLLPTLPKPLQEYRAQSASAGYTNVQMALLTVSALLFIPTIASYVGLYFWKRWARKLFFVALVFDYLVAALWLSPVVSTSTVYWLTGLASLTNGVLLAILYWVEPISGKFEADTDEGSPPGGLI